MTLRLRTLNAFLDAYPDAMHVSIAASKGSTPREAGTFMLVAQSEIAGTIGGGQLEFLAIDHARRLAVGRSHETELAIPLGPGIGQCCGGHVTLEFSRLDDRLASQLREKAQRDEESLPHIYIFGAGHVGKAMAAQLALLPYRTIVIDTRVDLISALPEGVEGQALALPEAAVRQAPVGSAFVAVTHDHALDFMITGEALRRDDAAYAGMIGSSTKRVQFKRWFEREGGRPEQFSRLISPIGGNKTGDKRPEIIAALTVAELVGSINEFARRGASESTE